MFTMWVKAPAEAIVTWQEASATLGIKFATEMDEVTHIGPFPTPTFLFHSPNAKHTQSAQHRSQNDNDGHGVRPPAHPPLGLLISGNLVAPLKMGKWRIHHSTFEEEKEIFHSRHCLG